MTSKKRGAEPLDEAGAEHELDGIEPEVETSAPPKPTRAIGAKAGPVAKSEPRGAGWLAQCYLTGVRVGDKLQDFPKGAVIPATGVDASVIAKLLERGHVTKL